MIGYATLGSNDLARAHVFYDAVFGAVGVGRLMTFPNGAIAWGSSWEQPMIAVGAPYDGGTATAGNGTMLALAVDSRAMVDTMYAAGLAAGGSDEGAPGVRGIDGAQAFYGGYFRDLDGNELCAFKVGPA